MGSGNKSSTILLSQHDTWHLWCALIGIRVNKDKNAMMEQTHLFQATVRTIRLEMKSQRREEGGSLGPVSGSDTSSTLLRKARRKTEFAKQAIEVVRLIIGGFCMH